MSMKFSYSTAVIGAGASGLSVLRTLRSVGAFVTGFELQNTVGGRWHYQDNPLGVRGYRSNINASFVCQIPKDIMAFSDHRFPFLLSQSVHHTAMSEYIRDYAEKKGLSALLRMNTKVESVEWDSERKRWVIMTVNVVTGEVFEWTFDAVVVASGTTHTEYVPDIPSRALFQGSTTHSLSFKKGHGYMGQKVVVVGGGPSGFDIALDLLENGASEIVHCVRNSAIDRWHFATRRNRNVRRGITDYRLADVDAFHENGKDILLNNGDVLHNVDAVIWATGYKLSYPFLPDDIQKDVISPCGRILTNCIHNIFYVHNPTLAFLGPTRDPIVPFLMAEYQSKYIAAVWGRKIPLPNILKPDGTSTHHGEGYLGWQALPYMNMLATELSVERYWESLLSRWHWWAVSVFFMLFHRVRSSSPPMRRIQHVLVSNKP